MYRFNYPEVFTTLPNYSAVRGKPCKIIRVMTVDEVDYEPDTPLELMWKIEIDGTEFHAWSSELELIN